MRRTRIAFSATSNRISPGPLSKQFATPVAGSFRLPLKKLRKTMLSELRNSHKTWLQPTLLRLPQIPLQRQLMQ